jgi:site-specific recombinase XerD
MEDFMIPESKLRQYAEDYVDGLNQYEIGSPATRKTRRDSLFGTNSGVNVISLLEHLGVTDPTDITESVLRRLNGILDQKISNLNSRTRVKGSLRAWLQWMIDSRVMSLNPLLLKILKQKQPTPEEIEIPTQNQIEILEAMTLGKDRLHHLMNYIMFVFLSLINGVRPGKEVVSLNVNDIKLDKRKIRIHRKGGEKQWIRFQKRHVPLLREYLTLLDEFKVKLGCNDPALFIKLNPKMGHHKHNPIWRLSKFGYWEHFRALQRKYPQLKGLKPYYLRHFACSIMAFNTIEHGGSMAETAMRNGHSVKTLMKYYYAFAGYRDEINTRRPHENIDYFKQKACRSIGKLIAAPNETEHLFSALEWGRKVGVTQNGIDMIMEDTVGCDMDDIQNGLEALKNNPTLTQELKAAIPALIALVQTYRPPKPSWPVLGLLGTSSKKQKHNGDLGF